MAIQQRMNLSDMPLHTRYLRVGHVGYNGKLNPGAQSILATIPNGEFVQIVADRRKGGKVYTSDLVQIAIYDKGWRNAAGGTGGSGSGGASSTGAQAAGAVAANTPAFTGGGQGAPVGAVQVGVAMGDREGAFRGVDTYNPDEKLAPDTSPDSINWDSFARIGSLCKRAGTGRLLEDRDVATTGGVALNAAAVGVSLCPIPLADPSDANAQHTSAALVTYSDAAIGTASANHTAHVTELTPLSGEPATLVDAPGPEVTLSDLGSHQMRVAVSYETLMPYAGQRENSIEGVTIAYSTLGYPRDPDGKDARLATGTRVAKTITFHKQRDTSWHGASTNFDITSGLAAGKYFVTVWGHTREGTTQPTYRSLTIA